MPDDGGAGEAADEVLGVLGQDGRQQSTRSLRVETKIDPELVGAVVDLEHSCHAVPVLPRTGGHEPGGGGLEGAR